ncbi:hypothetical protein F8388_001641 [Cannabis sativa]|uniref:Glycine-rich protein n=1 Tax=Cannabis sativa TaxID=3483 RepID=A0A7J6HJ17_CANSA|nr:hypothetical protein F8388_001641 [Cannabis sativa]
MAYVERVLCEKTGEIPKEFLSCDKWHRDKVIPNMPQRTIDLLIICALLKDVDFYWTTDHESIMVFSSLSAVDTSGVVKSKRSIWRLKTITDFFWSIVNLIGVFFSTMFSMEKSDAYRKGSASGKKWDGGGPGGPGGGPYGGGGGGGGPRGPRGGLDNVRGLDSILYLPVVPAAAERGLCGSA